MSWSKVFPIALVLGLVSLLVPVAIVVASHSDQDNVQIRDSDDTNYTEMVSDVATITITDVEELSSDETYEGWFVSDDGSRKQSTGILTPDSEGNISQSFVAPESVTTWITDLNEQNDSGQSGTATLTQIGDDTQVDLDISAGTLESTAVHIHVGPCDNLGGVVYGLTSFEGGSGTSTTLLEGVSVNDLLKGNLAINSHNTEDAGIYTTCGDLGIPDPSGENLFADFNTFVVTVEPTIDTDPDPSDVVAYVHTIPTGGILHIRHLLFSWTGNPPYESGLYEGTPKGIAVGLREQVWLAWVHAELAADSSDLAGIAQHAEHVVNIIEGADGENFGDIDGDGDTQNPGDGFGVLPYAADTIAHAELTVSDAPGDETIAAHSADVIDWANHVIAEATLARDNALLAADAVSVGSSSGADLFIGNVVDATDAALNGDDDGGGAKQAYWAAQDMGAYALDTSVDVSAPTVGDPFIPTLALPALALGVFFLLSGAYMYRRSRSRA